MNIMDGFPDWRDKSQYPATSESLSPTQWAWEFLRRNPEYKKDYASLDNMSDAEERRRLSFQIGAMYGLCGPAIDPAMPSSEIFSQIFAVAAPRIQWAKGANVKLMPNHVAVIIDMQLPIDQQLRKITPSLRDLQAYLSGRRLRQGDSPKLVISKKRTRKILYTKYLRALDAKDSGGFSDDEIGQIVHRKLTAADDPTHNETTITRYWGAAKRLRDGGYLNIAALDSYPT